MVNDISGVQTPSGFIGGTPNKQVAGTGNDFVVGVGSDNFKGQFLNHWQWPP